MYFEASNDPDDEWFYNSIQRYDDLLIYEFQGRVSSACFLNEEKLVAACLNLNGGNEILKLALPDKLIVTKEAQLSRNRDFNVESAGYSKSTVSKIISSEKYLVASEDNGINLYKTPDPKLSDMITYELTFRENQTEHLEVCFSQSDEAIFSGSNLNNIKKHSLTSGKEIIQSLPPKLLEDINSSNPQKNSRLSMIDNRSNDLILGFRDNGVILNIDLRTHGYRTIRPPPTNSTRWTSVASPTGDKFASVNCEGEILIFDSRNISKEVVKFESQFKTCENSGNQLVLNFDPKENLISVSGFDKCIKVFSLKSSSGKNLPIFVHDGHANSSGYICGHLWHPLIPNVIFSYDEKGILHAWKFK